MVLKISKIIFCSKVQANLWVLNVTFHCHNLLVYMYAFTLHAWHELYASKSRMIPFLSTPLTKQNSGTL